MPDFMTQVLAAFEWDANDELMWRLDDGTIRFSANVSDIFAWGCADAEEITPANVDALTQAAQDLRAARGAARANADVAALFAARLRGMRPQGALYKYLDPRVHHLFDACGPLRALDLANPRPHPSEAAPTDTTASDA